MKSPRPGGRPWLLPPAAAPAVPCCCALLRLLFGNLGGWAAALRRCSEVLREIDPGKNRFDRREGALPPNRKTAAEEAGLSERRQWRIANGRELGRKPRPGILGHWQRADHSAASRCEFFAASPRPGSTQGREKRGLLISIVGEAPVAAFSDRLVGGRLGKGPAQKFRLTAAGDPPWPPGRRFGLASSSGGNERSRTAPPPQGGKGGPLPAR